ncbi:MAG TPA: glycosyltransferase N-terminal domain-containing protein [Candidatus Limnocylindrales bacterium]|nr:glycosyltransferase N-terminal domain-containing protein [Candidatus Limnocylindrales bacterium]
MGVGLAVYRGVTWSLGLVLPAAAALGREGGVWRGALTGAGDEEARAAGSVWVHAASMGEVGAARRWVDALIESGVRPPLLLTTRTRTGLARARRDMGGRVAARIAPLDLPQTTRALFDAACPSRLDIVETEAWPNLILESRRAGVAVVFVSATVSRRTSRRLASLGVAGRALFGEGVFALAQDEEAAARFRALGIPGARVRLMGDLKADGPVAGPRADEASRVAAVFGSFRPGEEDAALAIAGAIDGRGLLVVAPRHLQRAASARRRFRAAGYEVIERGERERGEELGAWIARAAARPGKRVALLATHGELASAYDHARVAVVGGTFAPFGGHSPLEAAARGCPVLVGPYRDSIAGAAGLIARGGGGALVPDSGAAARTVAAWWGDGGFAARSAGAVLAASAAAGAARRGLAALAEWKLNP